MSNMKEKIKNAYLLFYERITPIFEDELKKEPELKKEESKDIEIEEEGKKIEITTSGSQKNIEINTTQVTQAQDSSQEEFLQEILRDNLKFHVHKNIFSPEYFSFIVNLLKSWDFSPNSDYLRCPFLYPTEDKKHFDLELLKFCVLFFFTCMAREKEKQHLIVFLPILKASLSKVIFPIIFSSFSIEFAGMSLAPFQFLQQEVDRRANFQLCGKERPGTYSGNSDYLHQKGVLRRG